MESCALKIIPQHIWKNVLPENFTLSSYNLQPIGSGPYILSSLNQNNSGFINSIGLITNRKYYGKVPYISNVYFNFFENKENLIKAINQKTIDGFSISSLGDNEALAEKEISQGWSANEKFNVYSFSLPRYFAVFFNTPKNKILSDASLRQALNYSVDKDGLAQKIKLSDKEKLSIVDSPILPDYFNYSYPSVSYEFDLDVANKFLDKSGYKITDSGQRAKANNKKPAFQFKNYLKSGLRGNEVTELQGCLSRLSDNFKTLLQNEVNGKYGAGTESAVTEFQKKYLPDAKATGETGPGTRTKLNELCFAPQSSSTPLQFTLITINQPQLVNTANVLKDYWQKAGITVIVKAVELSEMQNIIKNRDYDALLYGEALGSMPDLFPYWHSTQTNDPGLNLSGYQSKNADQLLKSAREALDEQTKADKYDQLQNIILEDAPALFLFNPDYLFWVSGKIKGVDTTKIVDPAKRFININNWFTKTHRVWK